MRGCTTHIYAARIDPEPFYINLAALNTRAKSSDLLVACTVCGLVSCEGMVSWFIFGPSMGCHDIFWNRLAVKLLELQCIHIKKPHLAGAAVRPIPRPYRDKRPLELESRIIKDKVLIMNDSSRFRIAFVVGRILARR